MGRTKRSVVLCVGMALLLFLGLIYAYSVLLAPLKAEFAWPMSGMTFIFALSISAFTVGGLASGRLMARRRVRRGLLLGASLLLVGFLGVPHAAGAESLAFAALMYGMLASFGIGLVYNIVIPVVSAWFPDKPGFAQGICLMGFGMGGFLLGPLATGLYAMFPWRVVIGCLGVVFAALIVASSFVIRAPRLDEIGLPEPVAGPARDAGAGEGECHGLLSSPVFYLEFLFLFFMGSNGMGITGIGRELPLTLGVDDMAAAFIIGFVNIGSGIGRFGGGVLLDRIGCERSMLGIAVMGVASPAIVAASLAMGSVALQLSGCLLFGVSWGAAIVTMPFITRREWGQADLAQNMAVVNTHSIFGALAGSFGAGLLIEATGSFYPVLGVMVVFALGALLVACGMARLRASIRVPSLG
ncbi:MAG: MFS transporter [Collinsella intestinalis]|nr:MFS transporter [Collinsella intestinalis]